MASSVIFSRSLLVRTTQKAGRKAVASPFAKNQFVGSSTFSQKRTLFDSKKKEYTPPGKKSIFI
jgi:hypothetical protein